MSIYLGEQKLADNTCSRNIGEIVASTLPITDAGLHLLDGSLISSTGSYAKFVNYIAGLYNQTTSTSTTTTYYAWTDSSFGTLYTTSSTPSVGDATYVYNNGVMNDNSRPITKIGSDWIGTWDKYDIAIEYSRNSSSDVTLTTQTPPPYFCSESDWQSSVSTYGVCGKFVYDSTNNTVRLPKITGFTEGTIDPTTLGDLTTAGLPNITGYATLHAQGEANIFYEIAGAFNGTGGSTSQYRTPSSLSTNSGAYSKGGIEFNASHSNSIYGKSSTVQPQSIKVLYYIVIASSITNQLNLDVADMADKDFSNITSTGTSLASGWSMPSSRYIDLTLGASGSTYIAPANGWYVVGKTGSGNAEQYITMINDNNDLRIFGSTANGFGVSLFIPVKKGDNVKINYTLGGDTNRFKFIYAQGDS